MLWLPTLCVLNNFVLGLCFNLDVDHPIVIESPDVSQEKSYFGYSVVLYSEGEHGDKWIKIGAPKGSYHGGKETIQQSGIVYHCPYMKICETEEDLNYDSLHNFDEKGNLTSSWTGGSMDISHKYKALAISASNWHYFTSYRGEYSPAFRGGIFLENFQKNTFLRSSPLKHPFAYPKGVSYYSRARTGFSLHFLKDRNELLVGAPGVSNYLGTVLKIKNIEKNETEWEYEIMSPRGNYYEYSGYALTSGCFYKKQQLYYVTGLPRGYKKLNSAKSITYGSVLLFTFTNTALEFKNQFDITPRAEFYGTQFGEYFGASLAAGDLNGDQLDDLIVGAPYRTNDKNGFNHGSVYVIYGHKRKLEHDTKNRIDGTVTNGQFGYAVMYLGNLDNDGYAEFAVSAPQEDTAGTVYIYTYDKLTKGLVVTQKIFGKNIFSDLRGFGMSFSRPNDIDDNHFSDIAVGAPLSGHAVVLRSKPIVLVYRAIKVPPTINKRNTTLSFKCCYSYVDYPEATLTIIRNLTVDGDQDPQRFSFESSEANTPSEAKEIKIVRKQEFCETITVFKVKGVNNYNDSISITLTYRIPENKTANTKTPVFISNNKPIVKDTFCKNCPLLSQKSFNSETKVVWDHYCGQKTCISKLEVYAKFGNLGKEDNYILGSTDPLILEVTVLNKGDSAYTPMLEILLPDGVDLRWGRVNCENAEVKIICDIGEELIHEDTYYYEFNIDEGISGTELTFSINSSTTTKNIGDRSSLNITLQLGREADFEITGESKEFSYVYTKEKNTLIQNIFKIEKMGLSPIPEIEANIKLPYKIKDSTGVYQQFAYIQDYQDMNMANQLLKCQNNIDFQTTDTSLRKRTRRDDVSTHYNDSSREELSSFFLVTDSSAIKNETSPLFDPMNMLYINCTMENVKCALIKCLVGPFEKNQKQVEILVEMKVNFEYLEDMLKSKDSVLITTGADIYIQNFRQSGNRSDSAEISNLVAIEKEYQISMWILMGSAIIGFVILVCLTTGLAKAGFFERKEKQKLIQLKEEALEEERFLEAMIDKELANENFMEECPLYEIFRNRKPTTEFSEEKIINSELLTQE